jgi:hypothetical protein
MGATAPPETHAGRLEELVRPLNDPELERGTPRRHRSGHRARGLDLAALAECAALPAEHPLRQAASAVAARVPRRDREGPSARRRRTAGGLAPQPPGALETAGARHRLLLSGEDEACRRYLEAIQPESAPARLVPAMQAMLGGKPAGLTAAAAALVSSTTSDPAALRRPLRHWRKLSLAQERAIVKAIREAVQACRETAPGQVERLKQHISVRSALADVQRGKRSRRPWAGLPGTMPTI